MNRKPGRAADSGRIGLRATRFCLPPCWSWRQLLRHPSSPLFVLSFWSQTRLRYRPHLHARQLLEADRALVGTHDLDGHTISLCLSRRRHPDAQVARHVAGGDHRRHRHGLSHGLFPRLPRHPPQGPVDHPAHHSLLDQLSPAGLRLENRAGLQRRHQHGAEITRHHRCAAGIPALQSNRGDDHPGPCLDRLHGAAHLRLARKNRPLAARSGNRSWRQPLETLLARYPAALGARAPLPPHSSSSFRRSAIMSRQPSSAAPAAR